MNDRRQATECKTRCIAQVASDAFAFMVSQSKDAASNSAPHRAYVPTGFHNIDKLIRGFYPSELAIVTGPPGAGKSTFASNLASKAAIAGAGTLLVSLEADSTMSFVRMCAADARVGIANILSGALSESDWASIADASSRLCESGLRVCDDVRLTYEGLESEVESLAGEADAVLVVFDGIELANDLVNGYASPMPLKERAIALKRLARCGHVPVVATAGYNPGSRHGVSDRDGVLKALPGGLEGVADTVIHIGRSPARNGRSKNDSLYVAEILIAKNGACAPSKTKLAFAPRYLRFMDYVEA